MLPGWRLLITYHLSLPGWLCSQQSASSLATTDHSQAEAVPNTQNRAASALMQSKCKIQSQPSYLSEPLVLFSFFFFLRVFLWNIANAAGYGGYKL